MLRLVKVGIQIRTHLVWIRQYISQDPDPYRWFWLRMHSLFLHIFFGWLDCVGHSFAYVAHFVFLRDVWILTQSAAVASRRANNLAIPFPKAALLPMCSICILLWYYQLPCKHPQLSQPGFEFQVFILLVNVQVSNSCLNLVGHYRGDPQPDGQRGQVGQGRPRRRRQMRCIHKGARHNRFWFLCNSMDQIS